MNCIHKYNTNLECTECHQSLIVMTNEDKSITILGLKFMDGSVNMFDNTPEKESALRKRNKTYKKLYNEPVKVRKMTQYWLMKNEGLKI